MTWAAQVWHVFRKDVREHWPLGLIVLGVAVALAYGGLNRVDPNSLLNVIATVGLPSSCGCTSLGQYGRTNPHGATCSGPRNRSGRMRSRPQNLRS
jgi:hypothetical protein